LDGKAFGYLRIVVVTPAAHPRLVELLHVDISGRG
ncbi:unnamed protein product, partial [Laminaria digitata]